MNLLKRIESLSKPVAIAVGFALVALIGFLDYLTGYELVFSLFYLLPIGLVTWLTSRRYGTAIAIFSAVALLAADVEAGQSYSHPAIHVWNTLIRFGFFITVVFLLSALRKSLEHEKELARTDALTGAVNSRGFKELIQDEINRSQRYKHPFSIVYMDLDDFKTINDQFGHAAGDHALREFIQYVRTQVRKTDIIARLGGDELALLLPETDQEAARSVVLKIQQGFYWEWQANRQTFTISIGVLSCYEPTLDPEGLIAMADQLMYTAKHGGKNATSYLTC